ncbi:hypothetical protein Q9R46_21480 [Paenibacillus sp. RRE4]|uniref:hypothetical protein n=1 Tax=Paenibacillus sp. RRE4 TaxID=2962587 RepID=UPI002880CF57|nr:hypothetical protein [Paenibacillus sp. RRE4]MDT0125252.1 hypothetical protein [Paenibacillus sp. RRE4]
MKRPPLFPGFDRSAGQNESKKPGNNPRPEEPSTPKRASKASPVLLPTEQRKGFRPFKKIAPQDQA